MTTTVECDVLIIGAGPHRPVRRLLRGVPRAPGRGGRLAARSSAGRSRRCTPRSRSSTSPASRRSRAVTSWTGWSSRPATAEPTYLLDRTAATLATDDLGGHRRPRRRHRRARRGGHHHRRHRQVQPPAAAGGRGLAGPRPGVLRAQLRAVRRQGRRHRRRRRQRLRLGAAPRAGRRLGDPGAPPRRLPGPRAHRPAGAGLLGARSSPRPRSSPCRVDGGSTAPVRWSRWTSRWATR